VNFFSSLFSSRKLVGFSSGVIVSFPFLVIPVSASYFFLQEVFNYAFFFILCLWLFPVERPEESILRLFFVGRLIFSFFFYSSLIFSCFECGLEPTFHFPDPLAIRAS